MMAADMRMVQMALAEMMGLKGYWHSLLLLQSWAREEGVELA